ncbi:MAG: cation:dicarboxylase symporter family transporter, partial [Pseudomonadota bacterium]|nr:cation:dicarboxylase symporter family transporter [Pseudomonadota bacterium]
MSHSHAMALLAFIIAGAVAGVFYGWYAGEAAMAVGWLGSLFLNALKMTIIPLVIASVVSGIGSLGDIRQLGKLGGYTMVYYLSTTAIAVFIGLLVVNWIQPGTGIQLTQTEVPEHILSKQDTGISDIMLSLISPNLIA